MIFFNFFCSTFTIPNELRLFLLILPFQTAFVVSTVFISNTKWEQATIIFYISEALVLLMGLQHWFHKKKSWPLSIILVLIYFFAIILQAPDFLLAFQTIRRIIEAGILCLLIWTGYLSKEKIIFWLAAGSIAPAILGIIQFFIQNTWSSTLLGTTAHSSWIAGASVVVTSTSRWLRAYGTFPHPNILGGFMVIVITQILFFLQSRAESINKKSNWFLIGVLIILTAALVVSFSRAAWLVWTGMIIFWHWQIFRESRSYNSFFSLGIFVSTLSFLILLGLLWPVVVTRLSLVGTHEAQSIIERVTGYGDAWGIFKNNWFWGVGPGNFTVFLQKQNPSLGGWQLQPVHNVFVLGLVEWGIFGIVFWYWFFYMIIKKIQLRIGIFAWGLLPLFILSVFDHYLYTSWFGLAFIALYISSTCYPQPCSIEPKNNMIYPH